MHRTKSYAGVLVILLTLIPMVQAQERPRTDLAIPIRTDDTCAAGFPGDVCASPPGATPEDILEFWDNDKMAEAVSGHSRACGRPTDGVITPGGDGCGFATIAPPYEDGRDRFNGVLFYLQGTALSHCTASVIRSGSESLVVTAAHCLNDGLSSSGHANWNTSMAMFVPAYNGLAQGEARAPLGRWPVQQAFVPRKFVAQPGHPTDWDVAIARVYPIVNEEGTVRLQEAVRGGYFPLSSDADVFPRITIVGYPSVSVTPDDNSVYGDGRQYRCESTTQHDPGSMGFRTPNCFVSDGNSGGPLVLPLSEVLPTVVGVVQGSALQTRLTRENFRPLYDAADSLPEPSSQTSLPQSNDKLQ